MTPEEMLSFLGGAALTMAGPVPIPPRIPPITPPGVPPPMPSIPETPAMDGGAADSLICLISFGILLGAWSWFSIISDLILTCTGAWGGGGGGGGGGRVGVQPAGCPLSAWVAPQGAGAAR